MSDNSEITVDIPELQKVIFKTIAGAVLAALTVMFKRLVMVVIASIAVLLMWNYLFAPKDSTDPIDGRSGLAIKVDAMTQCQYLVTSSGGITPRLEHGQQICGE